MIRFVARRTAAFLAASLIACCAASAGEGTVELKLWPEGAPGETGQVGAEEAKSDGKVTRISNVTVPTIRLFPAPADKANGCAVLIAPGGGYSILAWDLEGIEIAEWLNSIGVTAVLLKYRVPRREKETPHRAALQDAQRAMRLVRQHAGQWAIDPQRIGMLGFSAGGNLTVLTATQAGERTYEPIDDADQLSCRPDFLVPIYPAYLGDASQPNGLHPLVKVDPQTPPTFVAVTQDDADRGADAALLFVALKKAKVPAELHVFTKGGHGYGLRPSERPVSGWPKLCEAWLGEVGMLTAAAE